MLYARGGINYFLARNLEIFSQIVFQSDGRKKSLDACNTLDKNISQRLPSIIIIMAQDAIEGVIIEILTPQKSPPTSLFRLLRIMTSD